MFSSPAFQFYPADWLSDINVQLLTLEEEGAYMRLLSYCWIEGSIPNDPELCARLIGKGASTTLATKLMERFEPDPNHPSRLINQRLEREREKQRLWHEKSKLGGIKSGESRKKAAELKGGSGLVRTVVEPKANSSSSSSSSSSKEEYAHSAEGCHENVRRVTDSGSQLPGSNGAPAEIPSLEEVIDFGKSQLHNHIPEDYCRNFHAKLTEDNGWIKNGMLIGWKGKLPRYWEGDKHTWFKKKKTPTSMLTGSHQTFAPGSANY